MHAKLVQQIEQYQGQSQWSQQCMCDLAPSVVKLIHLSTALEIPEFLLRLQFWVGPWIRLERSVSIAQSSLIG